MRLSYFTPAKLWSAGCVTLNTINQIEIMAQRGALNPKVLELSKQLLGEEITVKELRLMPFLLHTSMNDQYIDSRKINDEELVILEKWREQGHVLDIQPKFKMTHQFYTAICEIVYFGYVDYHSL